MPRPLAGVMLFSDGLFAGGEGEGPDPLLLAAEAIGVPIATVSAGAPAIDNVALAELRAGEFAFVEASPSSAPTSSPTATPAPASRSTCAATASSSRPPQSCSATTASRSRSHSRSPQSRRPVRLRDRHPPLPGEATTANNRRAFVLKVLRDKVRVLHVAGRPNWDVRALRSLLGRDPNVELLSYYILRGIEDTDREDPSAELSLIAFPTGRLFKDSSAPSTSSSSTTSTPSTIRSAATSATSPSTCKRAAP